MSHAFLVLAAVFLCLACAGLVRWVNAPMFREPQAAACPCGHALGGHYASGQCSACDCRCTMLRARRPAVTASPEGPAPAPASGAGPAPTRTDLPIPPPRNGVALQDRPRQTVDVIICDPAVTPVVPRYYRAWLAGWWTP